MSIPTSIDKRRVEIPWNLDGERLDKALVALCPDLTRTQVQRLITEGAVLPVTSAKYKVRPDEVFEITIPAVVDATPIPETMSLEIVYEDEDLLVINKPSGLVVHPAPGHSKGTLVHGLLGHCGETLSGIGGVKRPGIVHRLDKDTSGLMVVAKNDVAHQGLMAQFQDRSLSRAYLAFVYGRMTPPLGRVDTMIDRHPRQRQKMHVSFEKGKQAITHYRVKASYGDYVSLVECKLETGRTHQIRVHMMHLGHPVVGDPLYGGKNRGSLLKSLCATHSIAWPDERQALHAFELKFIHPRTQEEMVFTVPIPADMLALKALLEKIYPRV